MLKKLYIFMLMFCAISLVELLNAVIEDKSVT